MVELRIFKTGAAVYFLVISAFLSLLLTSCSPDRPAKVVYVSQVANPETLLTQFKKHEIDGFLLWEPYPQEAALEGYGRLLKKSADIWPNHPDCIIAVSGRHIDQATLEAFIWVHIKSTRFINDPKNREKVIKYAVDFTKKDRSVVEKALTNIKFEEYPDRTEFMNYYQELADSPLLTKNLKELGYRTQQDFFNDFIDLKTYDFVRNQLDRDPDWRPAPVSKDRKIRFGRIVPGIFHLASYVAEKEGYYEKVGLVPGQNLDIQDYFHGIAIMQKFKTDELDIAYVGVAPATLKRINDGTDIRVVGGVEGEDSGLVVRKDEDIQSIADLTGKTLAVPAVGNVQYVILEKALRQAGLTPIVR